MKAFISQVRFYKDFRKILGSVPGLEKAVKKFFPEAKSHEKYLMMEFMLHGLSEYSLLSKNNLVNGNRFRDLFTSVFDQGEKGGM